MTIQIEPRIGGAVIRGTQVLCDAAFFRWYMSLAEFRKYKRLPETKQIHWYGGGDVRLSSRKSSWVLTDLHS